MSYPICLCVCVCVCVCAEVKTMNMEIVVTDEASYFAASMTSEGLMGALCLTWEDWDKM